MTLTLPFAAILGLLSLSIVSADNVQYRLHHRLYHPLEDQGPFRQRGIVTMADDNSVDFQLAPTFADDIASFAKDQQQVQNKNSMLYQVALEREGDTSEAHWDISSVKACHLPGSTAETIYLHVTDTHKPYAINYFVSPTPHNGACPKSKSKKSAKKPPPFESFANINTTVILKDPHYPPLPQLATPPPLTPEGAPVEPVPEKSLLQKYWMYGLAALVAIILAGPAEVEEKPRRQ
ncbi:hypothetical protein H0H92_014486 [Tricholoma furcatifolium]|nr:hypothetical protein H0H92_014486 [Tricholoma furcatifolium]